MLKTILFDLDGTLLPIDTEAFVKEYLRDLAGKVAPFMPPDQLAQVVLAATAAMITNADPQVTNQEAFFADFWPRVPHGPEVLLPVFASFYQHEFTNLRRTVTGDVQAGRQAVLAALDRGFEIVLATNPLFPEPAIRERMRWAGVDDLPWRLVTSYERMHFCKPHPSFYQEVLAGIGRQPGECLMIGNDVDEDGVAARVGIDVHLVTDYLINRRGGPVLVSSGPLAQLPAYVAGLPTA